MPLADAEHVLQNLVYLALALQLVAERGFFLLLWELRQPADVLRLNLIGDDREALKGALVVWRKLCDAVEDACGAVDVVAPEAEVVPADRFEG